METSLNSYVLVQENYSNYNLLRLQTPLCRLPHIIGKQYFMLQVPLTIDFVGTVSPLSEGWDSDNSETIQGSAGAVQAHCGRVVSKPVVADTSVRSF